MYTFEIAKSKDGQTFWRVRYGGEIIASSETHTQKHNTTEVVDNFIRAVQAGDIKVVDTTKQD